MIIFSLFIVLSEIFIALSEMLKVSWAKTWQPPVNSIIKVNLKKTCLCCESYNRFCDFLVPQKALKFISAI